MIALFLAGLIFFFAVFIQALTGFGLALLAVPFLILLYDPKVVAPVVMIVGAALSIMLFSESYRSMKPKQIFYLALGGIAGLPVGVSILAKAGSGPLRVGIGILIILFAILLSLGVRKKFKSERLTSVGVGFISGVFGGISSMVGPPIILFGLNQNWDKQSFRANLSGQMANFYKIPYHSLGPDSDSHCHDEQTGWEKMLTAVAAICSGTDLIVNAGMFGTGMTVSLEQLILDHEILSMAYRFAKGIKVDEETIALPVTQKVGPRGTFLIEEHTIQHLRDGERWEADVSNRLSLPDWQQKGSPGIVEKAKRRAKEILASHKVKPLDESVKMRLRKTIEAFEQRKETK